MNLEQELQARSGSKCELCQSPNNLKAFEVAPPQNMGSDDFALVCETCLEQIEDPEKVDSNHWRCLNDSMWNPNPPVQVVVYRMLNKINEAWSRDLIEMMYLDDDTLLWAKQGLAAEMSKIVHKDANGNILEAGDTVTLIQDLNVKGANFTAKRGTAVRRIRLVTDNEEHIEGKVNGQNIVILTKYVKKS